MSAGVRSPVEDALENQPFGALQLRVVLLCALVQAFDGFDLGTIGMAAPSLSKAWGVPPAQFTTAFVMSSVGILLGALSSGPLGVRFGRKPLLLVSTALIGVFSVASAFAWSVPSIAAMRLPTGLGIGGAMPAAVALASDYTPLSRRGTLIMLMFCGNTLGGFLGGQLVAQILPAFGWQSIFLTGGIPPLVLVPILMLSLPESPRLLIAHRADAETTKRLLLRLNVSTQAAATSPVDVARGNPVGQLFGGGLLALGPPPKQIFLCACAPALVAACATALLLRRGRGEADEDRIDRVFASQSCRARRFGRSDMQPRRTYPRSARIAPSSGSIQPNFLAGVIMQVGSSCPRASACSGGPWRRRTLGDRGMIAVAAGRDAAEPGRLPGRIVRALDAHQEGSEFSAVELDGLLRRDQANDHDDLIRSDSPAAAPRGRRARRNGRPPHG